MNVDNGLTCSALDMHHKKCTMYAVRNLFLSCRCHSRSQIMSLATFCRDSVEYFIFRIYRSKIYVIILIKRSDVNNNASLLTFLQIVTIHSVVVELVEEKSCGGCGLDITKYSNTTNVKP